jgi:hypothetical protein
MTDSNNTEKYLADTIMGRPYGFSVGGEHLALYPLTLGKMQLLQSQVERLEISQESMQMDVSLEALRLAKEKKDECITIISYHTGKNAEEVFDTVLMSERKRLLSENLDDDDIAALMIIVLTSDKTSLFMKHLGIDKEQERLSTLMRIKKKGDKNNFTFGGKSVYGTLIDTACERYGWTKEYVVWGIDFTSLRLMLADKINTVYCTDEEVKKIPASVKNPTAERIKAGKDTMAEIKSMDWK